ncbi:MAG: hypothetical protein Q9160_001577 [Pyrenula sp. 1 TL-2023]
MSPSLLTFTLVAIFSITSSAVSLPFFSRSLGNSLVEERQSTIPSFALTYAPLVYLDTAEAYFPSDIAGHVTHMLPEINRTVVAGAASPLTLDNLDSLNSAGSVYLTSKEGINAKPQPSWFTGVKPDASGKTNRAVSSAIIVADKGSGLVDVFYFYFYSYDQGNKVLGIEFGDHVGDWEHNMIRFQDGVPQSLWYSQHASGEAFTYNAVQKSGVRPITYIARGTHANYGTAGTHDHTIPGLNLPAGPLEDFTSQGALWDPTLSTYTFAFNPSSSTFTPYDPSTPSAWIRFTGQWGDQQLPDDADGQYVIFGQAKFVGGPTGPAAKDLGRANVCPGSVSPCVVRPVLTVR